MKIRILIFILLSLVIFSACKKEIFYPPQEIIYNAEENRLSWDKLHNVNHYELIINEKNFDAYDNTFDLSAFTDGVYTVKAKSIYSKGESLYSIPYTFTIFTKENYEVYVKEDTIYFKETPGTTYRVIYKENLDNINVALNENSFPIPDTLKDKKSTIIIETIQNNKVIDKTTFTLNMNITKVYKDEPFYVNSLNPKAIYLDGLEIKEGFTLQEDKVIFSDSFLNNINKEGLVSIVGEENQILRLHIIPKKLILLSETTQNFVDMDVLFEYQLNGYKLTSITSLNNPKPTDNDYTFNDGKLIIYKDYINYYMNETESKDLILQLSFNIEDHNEIVYLSITFPA